MVNLHDHTSYELKKTYFVEKDNFWPRANVFESEFTGSPKIRILHKVLESLVEAFDDSFAEH